SFGRNRRKTQARAAEQKDVGCSRRPVETDEAAAPTHEAAPHEDAMQEDRAGQAQERTDQPVPGGEDGVLVR
ncbi:Superfamily I DNA and RNA helicase and helicase subunit, partial [human gut metagenome]